MRNKPLVEGLRLVGPPETNKVMDAELSRLARRRLGRLPGKPARPGSAILVYPWDVELAWVAAAYHRTSARVLWDLWSSRAVRLEPLYDEVREQVAGDDRRWCWSGARISVEVRNADHVAAGPRQVVGAVKNAVLDGARARGVELTVDPRSPDVVLWVRGHDDVLTISIDLAGRARHLRGYRIEGGLAPLREPLAAALVMLSRWDARSEILLDPMAGSGTIAIEASLMATAAPLWPAAQIAASRLPDFAAVAAEPLEPLFADTRARVIASDVEPRAVRAARANRDRAGLDFPIERADLAGVDAAWIRDLAGDGPGVILCNPPYGVRLAPPEITGLYRDIGRLSRRLGWRAGVLAAEPAHIDAVGWRPRVQKNLRTGNLRIVFCLFEP